MPEEPIPTIESTPATTEAPVAEASAAEAPAAAPKARGRKKTAKAKLSRGRVYINSSYNNTIVTVTDVAGNVVAWGSAGKIGFKGSKKSTPYAGGKTMEDTLSRLK